MMATASNSPAVPSLDPHRAVRRARVALVCDLVEENWPSMELVADMLLAQLDGPYSQRWEATRLRPAMRRHCSAVSGSRFWNNADRLLNRFVDYPLWLRNQATKFDLYHLVDHSYSQLVHQLPAERTVVTCHDLDTFRCLLEPAQEQRPASFRAMCRRILRGMQKAAHVVTVSTATRDAILRYGLLPAERVTVVHNGVHPACSPAPDPSADAAAARLLPGRTDGTLWLLHVGSTIPRKRIDVLIHVFAAVRQGIPGARLVRVGGPFTAAQQQLARDLGVEDSIHFLSALTPHVLAAVYRRSDLLLQTSDSEGFGLPVIEAQACGCPVVASDIAVLREVGGSAAIYCPVGDVPSWKDAVVRLAGERMSDDPSWQHLCQKGIAQTARFSWAETASRVTAIYQAVLDRNTSH